MPAIYNVVPDDYALQSFKERVAIYSFLKRKLKCSTGVFEQGPIFHALCLILMRDDKQCCVTV